PPLVVAGAGNPSEARMRADPTSQGLGITNRVRWRSRNCWRRSIGGSGETSSSQSCAEPARASSICTGWCHSESTVAQERRQVTAVCTANQCLHLLREPSVVSLRHRGLLLLVAL